VSGWLLDTNVVSELSRPKPNRRVIDFVASQPLEQLFVSAVTLAELRYGIENVHDPIRRSALSDWLTHAVRPMFEQRILQVSEDVMLKWRILVEHGRTLRHTFSQPDLIIAATALQYGLCCVTRNTKDYDRTGAELLNPWQSTARKERKQ
jgi:predicted nucleic acid-binding protein